MLVTLGDKHFRLRKFPPLVGRELMVKGKGVKAIMRDPAQWIKIFSFVDVRLAEDRWLPLSTKATIANHVPVAQVEELLMLQLTDNCFCISDIIASPSITDALREEIYKIIDTAADASGEYN